MKEEIIDIIVKLTEYKDLRNNPNIDLIEENIIDSLSFIELIEELNIKYNIEIQPTQVPSDTWRSVENIMKMVKGLMKNE